MAQGLRQTGGAEEFTTLPPIELMSTSMAHGHCGAVLANPLGFQRSKRLRCGPELALAPFARLTLDGHQLETVLSRGMPDLGVSFVGFGGQQIAVDVRPLARRSGEALDRPSRLRRRKWRPYIAISSYSAWSGSESRLPDDGQTGMPISPTGLRLRARLNTRPPSSKPECLSLGERPAGVVDRHGRAQLPGGGRLRNTSAELWLGGAKAERRGIFSAQVPRVRAEMQ
jgi:hypothetical protein